MTNNYQLALRWLALAFLGFSQLNRSIDVSCGNLLELNHALVPEQSSLKSGIIFNLLCSAN